MPQQSKIKSDNPATLFRDDTEYSILEEAIDVSTQQEFFALRNSLATSKEHFIELSKEAKQNISQIFISETPVAVIKRFLVVLSAIDSIPVYRTLKRFSELPTPLQQWGIIAAQQSRMVISSSLMNNKAGIFISSGLGGKNSKLRYHCVFPYNKTNILEEFQEQLTYNELLFAIERAEGELENFQINKEYITAMVLLPLRTDIKELFGNIVHECNLYGDFLNEQVIITNVKELNDAEIKKHLSQKK